MKQDPNGWWQRLCEKVRRWRRRRRWPAELQLAHLRNVVRQDHRWMAHDPTVRALTERYLPLLGEGWEQQSVQDVSEFRRAIGCDPHGPRVGRGGTAQPGGNDER